MRTEKLQVLVQTVRNWDSEEPTYSETAMVELEVNISEHLRPGKMVGTISVPHLRQVIASQARDLVEEKK